MNEEELEVRRWAWELMRDLRHEAENTPNLAKAKALTRIHDAAREKLDMWNVTGIVRDGVREK